MDYGIWIKNVLMLDLFELLSSPDDNWWTGVLWIIVMFLSDSHSDGTHSHPLLRHWCRDTFLQIWWRNKLILILDDLRVNTFSTFKCLKIYDFAHFIDFCLWLLCWITQTECKSNAKTRTWIVILLEKPVPEFPSNDPFGFWSEALSEISLTRGKTALDVSSGLGHMCAVVNVTCSSLRRVWSGSFGWSARAGPTRGFSSPTDGLSRRTSPDGKRSLSDRSTRYRLQRRCWCDLPSGNVLLYPTPAPWMWFQLVCTAPEELPGTVARNRNTHIH